MAEHRINIRHLDSLDYPYDSEDVDFEHFFDDDWIDTSDRLYKSDYERHIADVRHHLEDRMEKKRFREENDYLFDEYDDL